MKKSTIWILTILMTMTFIGLLTVQISYMKNMIRMRDDQFSEGAKRSLSAVVSLLEQEEARHFIEDDVSHMESSSIYAQYSDESMPRLGGLKYSYTTSSGMEADLTIKGDVEELIQIQGAQLSLKDHGRSLQDVLRKQYIYQRGLIDEVIINIISQASKRPIQERADSAVVRRYLSAELENNGLKLPFEFAVVNRNGGNVYKTPGFNVPPSEANGVYVQSLFPNDPESRANYLKLFFPTKKDYIFSSVKFVIPSFTFTIILLIIFVLTVIIAFRQKKLTEMKNDFINNMTHEFKTPISTISLAAQMLNDDSVRKSPSMLQHISSVINDETKRLRFQVEKVLQMSMFDRQRATFKWQEVDANAAIAGIVSTFKLKVDNYGGKIDADLDAEDPIVKVDQMHFTNVIFNLLDNAVKYRKEDRPLSLKVASRNISGDRLEITVADNGVGIKKEDLKKVFDKFYRVSTGNRHDVKGFGLGLAYVHKMVRELGGSISVESEYNVGTKFVIILPLITKN